MIRFHFLILVAFLFAYIDLSGSETVPDQYQCHDLYQYDATTPGDVSSPFYGQRNSYHGDLWCEYKITAPEGHRIKVTFKDFDVGTEDCNHFLALYSKDRTSVLGNFCGSDVPYPIISKEGENEINLLFVTKGPGSGRGFLLHYESSPNFDFIPYYHQCDKLFLYDATTPGNVSSPFYGRKSSYHQNLWCEYKITAPEGYRIKVTFKDLDIDTAGGCRNDYLALYSKDKNDTLGTMCGTKLPRPFLSKEGENEIRILFRTRDMGHGRGFLLQYEASPFFTSVCEEGYKQCVNRECYKPDQKCDGVDDCGDGTDEEDCGKPIQTKPEKCGIPEIEPNTVNRDADRIVGGQEAIPNSWPWQVSLQYINSEPSHHFCGGSVINEQWVLTASHCIAHIRVPGKMKIRLGAHNLLNKTKYEVVRYPTKFIAYPGLEGDEILKYPGEHDITLLKLNAPVKFSAGIQPACLPAQGQIPQAGWRCYGTGWGESRGSGSSDRLKQLEMVVETRNDCGYYEYAQLCASRPYHSTCHGDSGGPFNCKFGDKWYVFGALSLLVPSNFATGVCGGADAKTLYTSTAHKFDWIMETVNKYS